MRRAIIGAVLVFAVAGSTAVVRVASASAVAQPSQPQPTLLQSDTTFFSNKSAWTPVIVPSPVSLEQDPFVGSTDVSVLSDAAVAGLVLREVGVTKPVTVAMASIKACVHQTCSRRLGVLANVPITSKGGAFYVDLPAGTYQAYVLTTGSAVTVRLHLHGLAPRRSLVVPARPARFGLGRLSQSFTDPQAQQLAYSSGGEHSFGNSGGLVVQRLAVQQSMSVVGNSGTCLVPGGAPVGGLYGLTCYPASGGYDVGVVNLPDPRQGIDGFAAAWFVAGPEHDAVGMYYYQASPTAGADAVQAYLDFAS